MTSTLPKMLRGFEDALGRPRNDGTTAPTLPETPEELAELLMDDKAVKAIAALPEKERLEWFAGYNKLVNKSEAISKQITEQVSNTMLEFLKDNGSLDRPDLTEVASAMADSISPLKNAPQSSAQMALYNKKALGAPLDEMFTDSADFFQTIWHVNQNPDNHEKLKAYQNAFSSDVPADGGFLVPEQLRSDLMRVALESALIRPRARVIPMSSSRISFPALESKSNKGSLFGGVIAYWTEEGATLTESQPKFGKIVLDTKKLTAYTESPNELIADSAISFQAFIDQIFPEALAWYEDLAFFRGSGTGEPLGFLNSPAAISIAKEGSQAADTIVWENIVKMFSRMLPSSLNRAIWIAGNDTFPQLATMSLDVGTGGSAIWLTNGTAGPPVTILGRPVYFTEKTELLGDAGDINFIDPAYYLIGDRQAMSAKSSEHYRFRDDYTSYRIIQRLDGRPWLKSAITPQNDGPTLSPFVKIAARA